MVAKKKSELMREVRVRRKKLGLVEFRAWCTPEQKLKLEQYFSKVKSN